MGELITLLGLSKFEETTDRVASLIHSRGFTIFGRIDHGAEANQQGLPLGPTELFIFGNPTVGTFLMQDRQTCGIDLPVKILVWEDESGKVWLTYNKMDLLKSKHQLTEKSLAVLQKIETVVAGICAKASKR